MSACNPSDFINNCEDNGLPRRTVNALISAGVALFIFVVVCGVYLRRRRLRQRTLFTPQYDSRTNQPKPYFAPLHNGYPVYYQTAPPAPPPAHIPQYPPRGNDTYHGRSQSQWSSPSNVGTPDRVSPRRLVSPRSPSSVASRAASSTDTTSSSRRPPVRQEEPVSTVPRSRTATPSSVLSRSTQRNTRDSTLSPPPSSPPPRSPLATAPSLASETASSATRPSALSPTPTGGSSSRTTSTSLQTPPVVLSPQTTGGNRPSNVGRPSALSPMHTGVSTSNTEPPPPYTLVPL